MKETSHAKLLLGLVTVGQLGITLITPILLCTLLGVWLNNRFSLGAWVVIVGVICGVISAGCSFYAFARRALYDQEQEESEKE